jgi:hypothetical protein
VLLSLNKLYRSQLTNAGSSFVVIVIIFSEALNAFRFEQFIYNAFTLQALPLPIYADTEIISPIPTSLHRYPNNATNTGTWHAYRREQVVSAVVNRPPADVAPVAIAVSPPAALAESRVGRRGEETRLFRWQKVPLA